MRSFLFRLLSLFLAIQQQDGCSGFTLSTGRSSTVSSTRHFAIFSKDKAKRTTRANTDQTSKSESKLVDGRLRTEGMPALEQELELAGGLGKAELSLEQLLVPLGATLVAVGGATALYSSGLGVEDVTSTFSNFQDDPVAFLQSSLDGLGPLAIVYFGALYVAAELLALPATPLTLSAGYLFGVTQGTLVILAAGTLSACIGFLIGKTLLREYVETLLEANPQFKKLDNAIGAEGFKLLVLVRLSPIFPFSLLNYTYGASSINFSTFVTGTLLGFAPSTLGYVYTGLVGKELLLGQGTQPWYVYAAGVSLLVGFLKLVTDIATDVVEAIEEEG